MRESYNIGDLVHIPQAVELIDCDNNPADDPQLTIPLRVRETSQPRVGIVTRPPSHGYVRIYCDGHHWTVKRDRIYNLQTEVT